MQGCLTVTLKLSAHLNGLHKMKVVSEYYYLLKTDNQDDVEEKQGACNTVLRVKPRLINVCGSLNCSFIMAYAMLTTFINVEKYIVVCSESEPPDTVISSGGHASKSDSSTEAVMAMFLRYLLSVDVGKRE